MTMSPGKKDYGHHNYPLERIEKAIDWLKVHGNQKIGIVGASTTGTLALTAASYFEDITLTIGLTPSDFIWQGFMQGKRDGCKEWPIEGESLLLLLDEKGIEASSGSACTSGSLDPSHVLLAIGLPHEVAHGSLRLTLCEENTPEQIEYIIKEVPGIVSYLRDISPIWEELEKGEKKHVI